MNSWIDFSNFNGFKFYKCGISQGLKFFEAFGNLSHLTEALQISNFNAHNFVKNQNCRSKLKENENN